MVSAPGDARTEPVSAWRIVGAIRFRVWVA